MGDFTSPNCDLISQERLQRRIEGYRKHHSDNKVRYDNYATVEHEKIKEDTRILYQKWLEGKNKKTKNKSNKTEASKELNQMKPKPKINAVKPMVINPVMAERSIDTSKQNLTQCNEFQKHPPSFQNAANTGSVRVNINLDANLAQTQSGITVRFSSRITENKSLNGANQMLEDLSNVNSQQSCKAEMSDLCDADSEFDNLLNSVPVDDDLPIDFEFLNGLDDSSEFFPPIASIPPTAEMSLSPRNVSLGHSVPNQGIISQHKATFQNQVIPHMQHSQNFPRIELNISSDMSKFSSILGETPGPAAETLKHLAAKHSQEKVQQKMIRGSDVYPVESPRTCYSMPHGQSIDSTFCNEGNAMMSRSNFRHQISTPQYQNMNSDGCSNLMVEAMKDKTPPCYQEAKVLYPYHAQVRQPNVQFVGQKLNIAGSVKDGDMEMKYDFEQCRLSQDSQSQMLSQVQSMGKVYPHSIVSQANSVDCFKMQQQKSLMYQRIRPYLPHARFNNLNNSSVPSNFISNQNDNVGHYENMSAYAMNNRQQVCMQPQHCAPFKQNSMALTNQLQARHGGVVGKDSVMVDDFKTSGMNEMVPNHYAPVIMNDGSVCHPSMNSQNIQTNCPDLFYGDVHPNAYQSFPQMIPASQMRGKWNNSAIPSSHPMASKGLMNPHLANYHDINQPMQQNCFPDNRSYVLNGDHPSQMYQFHCNNLQQSSPYFIPNQDGTRVMQYNRTNQAAVLQSTSAGPNSGYNSAAKRPVQNMMHPAMRMENFSYGY